MPMNAQLWIGFGFLVALVLFLLVAFFAFEKLSPDRRRQIKFLTALCAGMAGGFISGGTVFEAASTTTAWRFALSGTAGFALFWGVFLLYDRGFQPTDDVQFNLPTGATFQQAAGAAAQLAGVVVDFNDLTPAELGAPMTVGHIRADNLEQLFTILRLKTVTPGVIGKYTVTKSDRVYRFNKK